MRISIYDSFVYKEKEKHFVCIYDDHHNDDNDDEETINAYALRIVLNDTIDLFD